MHILLSYPTFLHQYTTFFFFEIYKENFEIHIVIQTALNLSYKFGFKNYNFCLNRIINRSGNAKRIFKWDCEDSFEVKGGPKMKKK